MFVFLSMIAYSAQDLILEPFAGLVFGLTPGETTQLSGVQNGGVLTGMLIVALFSSGIGVPRLGSLQVVDDRRLPRVGAGPVPACRERPRSVRRGRSGRRSSRSAWPTASTPSPRSAR